MTLLLVSALLGAGAIVSTPPTRLASSSTALRSALRMQGGEASSPISVPQKPIPVTLLSGFLGTGKTTLLRHLLENTENVRIGVIVNDVAAVNVDSKLVQRSAMTGIGEPDDMIELSNGCACCSAGDDLFSAISELVSNCFMRGTTFDHIVFEASGVAEPKLLRAAFQEAEAAGWPLMKCIRLENMVTVVDASNFLELYNSTEKVSDRTDLGGEGADAQPSAADVWMLPDEAAVPSVVQLLVEQVETADVLVLNKVDGVDAASLAYLSDALGAINGFAELLPTTFGEVAPSQVLVSEREAGVASSNEVMDHQSSIDFAKWLQANALTPQPAEAAAEEAGHEHNHAAEHSHSEHSHASEHSHSDHSDDAGCTDPSHDHDHAPPSAHEHSHAAHDHSHDSSTCDDPTHDHSHDSSTCDDPTHDHSHDSTECDDPIHDHSHGDRQQTTAATRFGITTFVYAARRPFVASRFDALLSALPFTRVVPPTAPPALAWLSACKQGEDDGSAANVAEGASGPFASVLRSKGFVWLADDSGLAFYWSQVSALLGCLPQPCTASPQPRHSLATAFHSLPQPSSDAMRSAADCSLG